MPIAISAFSGQHLERIQVTDTPSLGKAAPSLVMMRTGPFTQPYLRGVGKRSTLGVENSVSTYVDGVYLASSISALLDLRGIERVEVLNGPQGTLFGRNTTGGVIHVVTRDPSAESSGEASLAAGTYDYLRGDIYVTGGTDRIAGNLVMSLSRNGGYGSNLYTGKTDQGEITAGFAARSKWILRADSALRLTLAGDYQDIEHDFSQIPVMGYTPIGQPRVQDFRDRDQNSPNRYHFRYGGVSLKAESEIGGAAFMSLTAARWMNARWGVDLDLGPLSLLSTEVAADQKQISQEFQLQSREGSPVRWVAGFYFIRIEEEYDPISFAYGGSYSARIGGRTAQTLFSRGTTSSYAAYGQANVPIEETTFLTLGLRYTIEHRTVEANGAQSFNNPPAVRPIAGLPLTSQTPFQNALTFREPSWRASLDHHFSSEAMAYLSASRSFQSGGWNLQTPQNAPFGPEKLDDFEVGVKFADSAQRIQANANLFYYNYADVQVSAITPLGNATVNAASAEAYGLELQLGVKPDDRTQLQLGLAWLTARFKQFPNASCANYDPAAAVAYAPRSCDVSGNDLPFAPELKFNFGGSRQFSLGRTGDVLISGNLAYNSGYFSEPDNIVKQRAFAVLDMSANWQPGKGLPSLKFWATNIVNTQYYVNLVTLPTSGVFQTPAAPRRFGISITYAY